MKTTNLERRERLSKYPRKISFNLTDSQLKFVKSRFIKHGELSQFLRALIELEQQKFTLRRPSTLR